MRLQRWSWAKDTASADWSISDYWHFHFESYSFNRESTKAGKSKKILFSLHSFLQQWHTWCKHWGSARGKGGRPGSSYSGKCAPTPTVVPTVNTRDLERAAKKIIPIHPHLRWHHISRKEKVRPSGMCRDPGTHCRQRRRSTKARIHHGPCNTPAWCACGLAVSFVGARRVFAGSRLFTNETAQSSSRDALGN